MEEASNNGPCRDTRYLAPSEPPNNAHSAGHYTERTLNRPSHDPQRDPHPTTADSLIPSESRELVWRSNPSNAPHTLCKGAPSARLALMTGWKGTYTEGFSEAIRSATLRRDRTCTCGGCRVCSLRVGCRRPSVVVDHRLSWRESTRAGLNPNVAENAQGMCDECHGVKTAGEIARGRQRLVPLRATVHPSDTLGGHTPPPVHADTDGRTPAYAYDPNTPTHADESPVPVTPLRARLTKHYQHEE